MEDMMKALLDVVRAQHTATEGSEERPFDINDIILNSLGILISTKVFTIIKNIIKKLKFVY